PHPGPVVAAGLLGVDLGWIILMGLACGLPAFVVSGLLFPLWIGKRIDLPVPEDVLAAADEVARRNEAEQRPEPALGTVAFIIGLPMVLILGATFGSITLPEGSAALSVLTFLGNPTVALTIAVLLAF